jgi:hypothetical protein
MTNERCTVPEQSSRSECTGPVTVVNIKYCKMQNTAPVLIIQSLGKASEYISAITEE